MGAGGFIRNPHWSSLSLSSELDDDDDVNEDVFNRTYMMNFLTNFDTDDVSDIDLIDEDQFRILHAFDANTLPDFAVIQLPGGINENAENNENNYASSISFNSDDLEGFPAESGSSNDGSDEDGDDDHNDDAIMDDVPVVSLSQASTLSEPENLQFRLFMDRDMDTDADDYSDDDNDDFFRYQ